MRTRRCSVCHVDIEPGTGWAEVTWRPETTIKRDGTRVEHGERPISTFFCDEHPPEG